MGDPNATAEQEPVWTDPADSPAASYCPDMAEELDTLGERWAEGSHRALAAAHGTLSQREARLIEGTAQRCAVAHSVILNAAREQIRAEVIRKALSIILDARDPRIGAYATAFAVGLLDLRGWTMTECAKRLGVTRAAISKMTVRACNIFGLPPSRYMKSEAARDSYREVRNAAAAKKPENPNPNAPTHAHRPPNQHAPEPSRQAPRLHASKDPGGVRKHDRP